MRNYVKSSLQTEHLAQSILQSRCSGSHAGSRACCRRSAAQGVLEDLAALVSINVLDLVAVETTTATTADKLDSVQVGHAQLNHGNGHQDGCTAQSCHTVDGNCGRSRSILLFLTGRRRSTAATNNTSINQLQPVLDNVRGRLQVKQKESRKVSQRDAMLQKNGRLIHHSADPVLLLLWCPKGEGPDSRFCASVVLFLAFFLCFLSVPH